MAELRIQELVEQLRDAAARGVWSQGAKLARSGAVVGENRSAQEAVLRVKAPGLAVAPTVVLYTADGEWDCDCPSPVDPCAHVVAATLALAWADEAGHELPGTGGRGVSLRYRLARVPGGLALARFLVEADGSERPLLGSLLSRLAGGGADSALTPTQDDLQIDRILEARRGRPLGGEILLRVLVFLTHATDLWLDGQQVKASEEPVVPRGLIENHGDSVRFTVNPDPSLTEVVVSDVALCGDTLRPLGATILTGDKLQNLPLSQDFTRPEWAELVSEILPPLKKIMPVEIRTDRLPVVTQQANPRIVIDVETRDHNAMSVLPSLVYGNPPLARVDAGRLVHVGGAAPLRDRAREERLLRQMRDELHLVPGRRVDFFGKDAVDFAAKLDAWRGGSVRSGGEEGGLFFREPLIPRLELGDDRAVAIAFETAVSAPGRGRGEVRRADPAQVLRAWRDGLEMVPLLGGGWSVVPAEWLDKHGHQVADLLAARDGAGKIAAHAVPALAALCEALDQPRPGFVDRLAPLLGDFDRIPAAPLPELRGELRPYQRQGVNWLCFLRDAGLGAVLADDMGLGKTIQALAAVRGRTLVVCPRSVVHNWAGEIQRFRPALRVSIYHGAGRHLEEADVTITTYALLRADADLLAAPEWDAIILDESQAIKNPTSGVARAAYGLRGRFRLALSGTPVENRLDELWSVFHFTNPGLLGARKDFRHDYAAPIGRGQEGAVERLRAKVRPFLLRREKRTVAPELPPRTEILLHCELDEEQRGVYDAVWAASREDLVARIKGGGDVLAVLEALLRLRQAACHPALVPSQSADRVGAESAKVTCLLESLEDAVAEGHKSLVFSQWTSFLDLIEPPLRAAAVDFVRLDGSTRDRAGVVDRFQDPSGPPVMLISLKAGGTGLNLTAADHVFILDPWWNPAVEDQAADRTHRIGQDKPVFVYRLVAKDTVEERVLDLQERKRQLASAALGGADRAAALTRDDLLALLDP